MRHHPDPHPFPGTDPMPPEHQHEAGGRHGGHRLMMMVCCIPMIVIALVLGATGAAGSGIVLSALLCTAMMTAMMFAMPGGHGGT